MQLWVIFTILFVNQVVSRTVFLISNYDSTKIMGQDTAYYQHNIGNNPDWRNQTQWSETEYEDGVVAISGNPNAIASYLLFESLFKTNLTENIPATLVITCLSNCVVYMNNDEVKQISDFINQDNGSNGHYDYCSYDINSYHLISVILMGNKTNNLTIVNSHNHCSQGRDIYAQWLVFQIYSNQTYNSSASSQIGDSAESTHNNIGIIILWIALPIALLFVLSLVVNKALSALPKTANINILDQMEGPTKENQAKSDTAKTISKQTL